MLEGMMTQEEDDLEEELSGLDIREDHGAEDSDVTPINTPPSSPPILYIKKYPPVAPPQNDGKQNFRRYSRADDFDHRSESSLSWGDDEFEGEATKQVSVLFDQVDYLLYKEKTAASVVDSSESEPDSPIDSPFYNENLYGENKTAQNDSLVDSSQILDDCENSSTKKLAYEYPIGKDFSEGDVQSSGKIFNFGRFLESSAKFNVGSSVLTVSNPAPELQEECDNWVQEFPHFRVRGLSVDSTELRDHGEDLHSDQQLLEDKVDDVIVCDGDFDHMLPLVVYNSANQVRNVSKDISKRVSSSNRVCSGSSDPEVLKEQVLIILFEKIWETVTKTIEPLLYQYARYIIEQSVQYLSISREPSTRGSRISGQRISQNISDVKVNNKFLMPSHLIHRPFSGTGSLAYRSNRPISSIRRPSSAVYKIQNNVTVPDIHQEELQELLQVSSKPLQNSEDRMRPYTSTPQTRESSAMSCTSRVSFPIVTTPRDANQRPVSSKSTNIHLTPTKTNCYITSGEQRPASTSSFSTRMRFQEKYQNLNRQCTIQELGTDITGPEAEEVPQEHPSPVWSRHIPFLPPITDNAVIPLKVQHSNTVTREDKGQPMLCVRGTLMSASHRSDVPPKSSKSWVSGMQPVEPFLSWVVERVDSGMQSIGEDQHLVVKNSLVKEDSKSICMYKTKHFRRYSHH